MPGPADGHQAAPRTASAMTRPMKLLFAASVGVIVTNLFAPQTLIGPIGASLDVAAAGAGLIATATLAGYAAGLFLLVPLADLLENRALVTRMLVCAVLAAAAAGSAPSTSLLIVSLFVLGAACSAIQILVPIAASMAPPDRRGRVIGEVMSGLMVGILLSRPMASIMADAFGWRAFFGAGAATMLALTAVLALRLPRRQADASSSYPALIASLWLLLRGEAVLRRRALSAALCMAAFSLYWTSIALRLAEPPFMLGQRGIALFAMAGVSGVIVTPLAGRAGDRGRERATTSLAHLLMLGAFALAAWAGTADALAPAAALGLLALTAVLLDAGVTGDQTIGRRAVNLLQPAARGRLNGLFVGLFFLGGALGAAAAGPAWAWGGWPMVCALGALFALACLLLDLLPAGLPAWRVPSARGDAAGKAAE